MDNKEKETNTLDPVSVRLSPEILSVIDIIVANNGRTRSEILRLLTDKRLLWYVPKIHFVEHDVCIGKVCAYFYVYVWMSMCTVYNL